MNFFEEFEYRGYFYQCTDLDGLKQLMSKQKIVAYIGMDATAPSLHVGNLMQIMILRMLQRYGHKPIIIIGGATTQVGDPSGKTEMRKILSMEEINNNINSIKKSLENFISFGNGSSDAIILNNATWLEQLNYLKLLKDYGRFFSVNKMLTMDSVKSRLDRQDPLTFLEFNYMILQAYDFYYLFANYDCSLQIGGSDQWGNIVMGVDLIRKSLNKTSYGLTTPLLVKADGSKMGKSANGAIWINKDLLSPYEYFQFWRNIDDSDVMRFSRLYAEFNDKETEEFQYLIQHDINAAKKLLAYNVTTICHGEVFAKEALNTAEQLFENKAGDINNLPTVLLDISIINKLTLIELLVILQLAESKTSARNLIKGNGIKVNDIKINDENLVITNDMLYDNSIKISKGKKVHIIVKIN